MWFQTPSQVMIRSSSKGSRRSATVSSGALARSATAVRLVTITATGRP
ncbi:hypothetical protein [Actinoplanes sp. OR16]|nr:hypothetical protein [Actinoplanes sp. OR16]